VGFDLIACCGGLVRSVGLLALALTAANAERHVALVLGAPQYKHAPPLANPVREPEDLGLCAVPC
jgi:hypothetical protein